MTTPGSEECESVVVEGLMMVVEREDEGASHAMARRAISFTLPGSFDRAPNPAKVRAQGRRRLRAIDYAHTRPA